MSSSGAKAALLGYRLQFLYTLHRVLTSSGPNRLKFQLENFEDMAVYSESEDLLEVVQVKAHSSNLSVSAFSPSESNSFFRRAIDISSHHPRAEIKIASFGRYGPEMLDAWKMDGEARGKVRQKLLEAEYARQDIEKLFQNVQLISVTEEHLREEVLGFLRNSLAGGEPENASDLLIQWVYMASENREFLNHQDLIQKINSVGRYLSERSSFHQEWFATIEPIEDNPTSAQPRDFLKKQFAQGINAQYEHILADVDVRRTEKLQAIERGFQKNHVVIIHGASGQGKSALAYRYLHDYLPEKWRFSVRKLTDHHHTLRVGRALAGHMRAVNVPVFLYLDVSPRDNHWPELIRNLSREPNIQILVTIREEDWRRTDYSFVDFAFSDIDLSFDIIEARQLFEELDSANRFLSFEDAWERFGGEGPLLEFAYLVTQDVGLSDRLKGQVKRLQDEVRSGKLQENELEFLRLAAVASSYEARLDLEKIARETALQEPIRTLELFEKEYLIRRSDDGRMIEGLHAIRSGLLVDFMTDPAVKTWAEYASKCIPLIPEEDLEIFLLHSFSRRRADTDRLIRAMSSLHPKTWTGLGGICRALLWLGIRDYVDKNKKLIQDAFSLVGSAWMVMLDFDLAGVASHLPSGIHDLFQKINPERGKILGELKKA